VEWLCAHGADVFAATHFGQSPLHFAAVNGHVDVCRALTDAGCQVDQVRVYPDN
jgi:ankyrin repeat protein